MCQINLSQTECTYIGLNTMWLDIDIKSVIPGINANHQCDPALYLLIWDWISLNSQPSSLGMIWGRKGLHSIIRIIYDRIIFPFLASRTEEKEKQETAVMNFGSDTIRTTTKRKPKPEEDRQTDYSFLKKKHSKSSQEGRCSSEHTHGFNINTQIFWIWSVFKCLSNHCAYI